MRGILKLLFAVCLFSVAAWGQTESVAGDGYSVRLMSWSGSYGDLFLRDGSDYLPVEVGEFALTFPMKMRTKPSVIKFFREVESEGRREKLPVAEVPVPDGIDDIFILLVPAAEGGPLPLEGRVIDWSFEAYPPDTMRVFNFSGRELAVRVNGGARVIVPGEEWTLPFVSGGPPQMAASVAVNSVTGEWVLVQSSMQPTPRGSRVFGIIRDGRPDSVIDDVQRRTKLVDVIFNIDRIRPEPVP